MALLIATVIQFGLPLLIELFLGLEASSISGGHHWDGKLERNIEDFVGLGIGILLMPLVATMLSMVYLKARQLGGEPVEEVLAPFEQEENLYSDWQARLHSSLSLKSLLNKSSSQRPTEPDWERKSSRTSRYIAPSLRDRRDSATVRRTH